MDIGSRAFMALPWYKGKLFPRNVVITDLNLALKNSNKLYTTCTIYYLKR